MSDSRVDADGTAPHGPWLHGLWLVLFVAAFAPTVAWLWSRWTISIWTNGHSMFIPLIVAWLVWDKLRFDTGPPEEASPWGFAFLFPALGLLAFDAAIHTQILSAIALVLTLPGLSLLLLGARRTRAIAFPLVLAAFMLPIPAAAAAPVHLALRQVSAWGSEIFVYWIGIPVTREHTTLLVPQGYIEVSDACSGFSTFYASLTLGLILAYMATNAGRRIVLLVGAAVLAVICNMVRVTMLVILAHVYGFDILATRLHETSGLVAFGVTLVLLFALAERQGRRSQPT